MLGEGTWEYKANRILLIRPHKYSVQSRRGVSTAEAITCRLGRRFAWLYNTWKPLLRAEKGRWRQSVALHIAGASVAGVPSAARPPRDIHRRVCVSRTRQSWGGSKHRRRLARFRPHWAGFSTARNECLNTVEVKLGEEVLRSATARWVIFLKL